MEWITRNKIHWHDNIYRLISQKTNFLNKQNKNCWILCKIDKSFFFNFLSDNNAHDLNSIWIITQTIVSIHIIKRCNSFILHTKKKLSNEMNIHALDLDIHLFEWIIKGEYRFDWHVPFFFSWKLRNILLFVRSQAKIDCLYWWKFHLNKFKKHFFKIVNWNWNEATKEKEWNK